MEKNVPARYFLEDVESLVDDGMKLSAAVKIVAKETNVGVTALSRAWYRAQDGGCGHGNRKLTDDEEVALCMVAISFSRLDLPLTRRALRRLVHDTWNISVGDHWVRGFLHRHKNALSVRIPGTLDGKRHGRVDSAELLRFLECFGKLLACKKFSAKGIVNYDETRIFLSNDVRLAFQRITEKGPLKVNLGTDFQLRFSATALPFVSAAGELLCVYLVVQEDKDDMVTLGYTETTLEFSRGKVTFFLYSTKSSYVDKATFADIISHFMDWYRAKEPGLDVILVGDNLGSHKNSKLIEEAFAKNFYMLFLLEYTTHWSQALDWILFGRLKKRIRMLVEDDFFDRALCKNRKSPAPWISWLRRFCGVSLNQLLRLPSRILDCTHSTQS